MRDNAGDGQPHPEQAVQETVVDGIRDLILRRKLRPGEHLVQSDLAEQFGVSRTPIREALHQLASEGLVTFSRNKGATVAKLSLSDLQDVYSVRIPLESFGTLLAAEKMTEDDLDALEAIVGQMKDAYAAGDRWELLEVNRSFYKVLYSITGRQRLYDLIMRYIDLADLYRRMAFSLDAHYSHTIADHEDLLATLRKGNPEAAEQLARKQMETTAADLVAFLGETE